MRPTTASDTNIIDINHLLHPGTRFELPNDVVSHSELSLSEKRAILAPWASDAAAITSCPALRAPHGLKKPISIDEILEALQTLDGGPKHPPGGKPNRLRSTARNLAAGREGLPMSEVSVPKHIADKLEHRWASRLEGEAAAWRRAKPARETTHEIVDHKGRLVPIIFTRMPLKAAGINRAF